MKIWGHTLFKNEERWLWYSVTSVIDHLDKLLLWDTGSTDNSPKIAENLAKKYPDKIKLKQYPTTDSSIFPEAELRQAMLNETEADWFVMVDADEIWPCKSMASMAEEIAQRGNIIESIVVPTVNLVGDIFHYQPQSAGRYKFGERIGHYALRAVSTRIPGLQCKNPHGTTGWFDNNIRMIQDRGSGRVAFVDAPYLHTTFLPRSNNRSNDLKVPKRASKLKFEIGQNLPRDYFFPEVMFVPRPEYILSPWQTVDLSFKFRAYIETPLRWVNRKLTHNHVGY
jgi:glycosyltransferase involved in cell wall biosynthesis